jgi:hypothetical protein
MRPRFRYSLRAFLIAVVAVGATVGMWVGRARDQEATVLTLMGVRFVFVYDIDDSRPALFRSLRRRAGEIIGKD